ncbi:hypothetical protein SDC9_115692 [bioreactor metagenome]|uniref:Uncharacterized protein n=1 Tax=bioreactor metagenome TaxID=1076179 RepID=A0A645BUK8_9ZZZZ
MVGDEAGKQPDPGPAQGRLHVDQRTGRADRPAHLRAPDRGEVERADVLQGVDVVDQRMVVEVGGGVDPVLGEVGRRGVHAEGVPGDRDALVAGDRGPSDHHPEVLPRGGGPDRAGQQHQLQRDPRRTPGQVAGHLAHHRRPERVGDQRPDEPGQAVLRAGPRLDVHQGTLDRLGRRHVRVAELRRLPAAAGTRQQRAADRGFERGDPARHRGVVDPESGGSGGVGAVPDHLQEQQHVICM